MGVSLEGPPRPSFSRAVRALIVAHVRSASNAALRDAGRVVVALAAVGTVLLGLLLTGSLAMVFGLMGYAVAGRTYDRSSDVAVWVFSLLPLLAAVVSLMGGDARALDWEKLKPYPVPRGALFAAELLASSVNPISVAALISLVVFTAALGVSEPRLLTRLPIVALTSVALLFTLRAALATVVTWLVDRLRTVMVAAMMLTPMVVFSLVDFEKEEAISQGTLARLNAFAWTWLPAGWQLGGTSRVLMLVPLLVPFGLVAIAYALAFREAPPPKARAQKLESLWSFRSKVGGLARLGVQSIWSSEIGRFTAVMPSLWVIPTLLMRQRLMGMSGFGGLGDPGLLWLFAWVMAPNLLNNLLLNQFGPDRGSVKALLLLPLGERDLLRGKALALFSIAAANAAVLAPVVFLLVRPPLALLAAGPLAAYCLFVVNLTAGQFTSVVWPRPLPRKGLRAPVGNVVGGLVATCIVLFTMAPVGILWWALRDEPVLLTLALLVAALVATALFALTSRAAEHFLAARREKLVETLG